MKRFAIEGQFWSAGDINYIDIKNDDGSYTVVSLNDFMRNNIEQEAKLSIIIDVKE